jgi:transcriptional regulator with XRE-family HTH domain
MRIGQLLADWRFLKKWSLREAGARIGISASTLMYIEKGKIPDGATLLKLQAWLFGESEVANGGPVPSNTQPHE